MPDVQVVRFERDGDRSLTLRHQRRRGRPLSAAADEVVAHLRRLWGFPVRLETWEGEAPRATCSNALPDRRFVRDLRTGSADAAPGRPRTACRFRGGGGGGGHGARSSATACRRVPGATSLEDTPASDVPVGLARRATRDGRRYHGRRARPHRRPRETGWRVASSAEHPRRVVPSLRSVAGVRQGAARDACGAVGVKRVARPASPIITNRAQLSSSAVAPGPARRRGCATEVVRSALPCAGDEHAQRLGVHRRRRIGGGPA